jgi:hypothetical protein
VTREPAQGEAVCAWGIWAALTLVVVITYSWLDPAESYNV